MQRPLASAIIPTYNRGYIVCDAIESALAQGSGVEVLVADDGSTDDTAERVAGFGERVVYLRQPHRGAAEARNLAVRSALGEYLSFLDSDDLWLPGKLDAELELFEQMPEADVVVTDASSWREDRQVHASWLAAKEVPIGSERAFLLPGRSGMWLHGSRFATCSITLRRRCLELLGSGEDLFHAELARFEDWEMEIRLFRYCRIAVLPRVLSKIRRYDDGTRARMPGAEPTAEESRRDLRCEIGILEEALTLGWPEGVERKAKEKIERLSARARGNHPRG